MTGACAECGRPVGDGIHRKSMWGSHLFVPPGTVFAEPVEMVDVWEPITLDFDMLAAEPEPKVRDDRSWQEKFDDFHTANPQVYAFLEERARQVYRPGRRIGIDLLINQMRWESMIHTDSEDGYKINQNFASRYARLIIANHPEWDGLFEFRQLRS